MEIPDVQTFFNFSGKRVLVTGAARGIGRGIARRFAQAGATVAVHYHTSLEPASRLVAELRGAGAAVEIFEADLRVKSDVDRLVAEVTHVFGGLDILVNNAGNYPVSPFLELSEEEWQSVIGANLDSVFLCSQAAARQMVKQGCGGCIINIASIEGNFTAFGHSHYNAAKAAVLMFTKSIARDLAAHTIRVNAVSPGLIDAPGLEEAWPSGVNAWRSRVPNRLGQPEDIGDACLFLASPAARWITGIDLVVDGGASTTPAF